MMQPTLAGFMKRPRIEEISQPIVDTSHEPVVEIPHAPVGEISHEPVGPSNPLHDNLDLNVVIDEDSYEHQPSFLNEPEPPFLEEGSHDPQPTFLGEGSSQLQPSWSNHVTEEHEHLHMPMLDRLASGGDEGKSLTTKERGFRDQWKLQFPWVRPITVNGLTRVKCIYCERFQVKGPLGKGEGTRNLQKGALIDHNKSTRHCYARTRWLAMNGQCKPIPQHVSCITEGMKAKIICAMKFMYFIALNCLPMSCYTSMCNFAKDMDFGGLPGTNDYATYGNAVSGREFVTAISQHIESKQVEEVRSSPCFSLLLDESIDRSLESHLIVYLSYIDKGGLGQPKSLFLSLSAICNGTAQSIYDAWMSTCALYRLESSKLVGLATDGAAAMLGVHNGFAAKLKRDVPGLFSVHCIAHREALAASDAFKKIKQLGFLERLANRIYGWIGMSSLRNGELQGLLKIMDMEKVKLLHVHSVRWLSMGQVMTRFADILPALLTLFRYVMFCSLSLELLHKV